MKRAVRIILCVLMVMLFTACGKQSVAGSWEYTQDMSSYLEASAAEQGLTGVPGGLELVLVFDFGTNGTYHFYIDEAASEESFNTWLASYKQYTIDYVYAAYKEKGLNKEQTDSAIRDMYGKSTEEYVSEYLASYTLNDVVDNPEKFGKYREDGSKIYFEDANGSSVGYSVKGEKLVLTFDDANLLLTGMDNKIKCTSRPIP